MKWYAQYLFSAQNKMFVAYHYRPLSLHSPRNGYHPGYGQRIMDMNEEAAWTIEDREGNAMTINGILFSAYYKARALDSRIVDIMEVTPSVMDLRAEDGTIINTIRKATTRTG
jgi:hypothetical protein